MKTKQLKSTGILVVILVILAGAAWWLMSTQDTAVSKKTVFQMPEKEITGLTVEKIGTDGKPMKIVLKADAAKKWQIVEPIQDPAYQTTVENLTKALAKVETEVVYKDIKEAGNLADFGLDKPAIAVQASFKGKKAPKKLLIGAQTPVGYKFFAKFEDDPRLLTVESTVKTSMDQDLNAFREKQLTATPKEQIQTIRLWSEADKVWYQLVRKNGAWRMTEPYQEEGSETNIDSILGSLTGLMINEYLEDTPNLAQYGLNQPVQRVELTSDKGEKFTLQASPKDEKWYLKNSQRPGIFQVNNISAMDFLNVGLKDLIGTKLFNDPEKEIQSFTVQVGSGPEKKAGGKDFTEIRKQLMLSKVGKPYFRYMTPVTRDQFNEQPVYGLTINRKGSPAVRLVFYINPDSKQNYVVTDSERPFVYELADSANERTLFDTMKSVK